MAASSQSDLVRRLIAYGITDARLLQAFRDVPRAAYVPAELVDEAYADKPLPISHAQVTTQPSLIATMIEALGLTGSEKVLEVGSGYGFQTALLARLARFVWSIEWWPNLADVARANLRNQGITNVDVRAGDGTLGLPDKAPFDAIVVSAAFPHVPPPLIEQLAPGGKLIQPIGSGQTDDVTLFVKRDDELVSQGTIIPARFVRLQGRHGFPRS